MIKKLLLQKLVLWLTIAGIFSICIFTILMQYSQQTSSVATAKLGSLYMSEMMFQLQDHFKTIVDIKSKEVAHIAEHTTPYQHTDFYEHLQIAAKSMDYDYLAIYDENGNYEMLLGEAAWYRNLNGFISKILAGENTATTGYLTSSDGKYLVFGFPAQFEMSSGSSSVVLLAGFSVEKLYNYINLDELKPLGSNVDIGIILTNGSYILKPKDVEENSFFDYINHLGSFISTEGYSDVSSIEAAMSRSHTFSSMVSFSNKQQHIYGAPANAPEDWYFIISLPLGITDEILAAQNATTTLAFAIASIFTLALFFCIFFFYLRLSTQQLRETEAARAEAEAARAEAETASMAKSTFLSNMSHDIRTPMNAIIGFTSMIEDGIANGNLAQAQEALYKIKRSSDYLRNLICDVLDMSKIESGTLALMAEPMSLQKTLDMISTLAHAQTASNGQTFVMNVHNILQNGLLCDQTRLNQILVNLISNAVKFTPEGGTISFELWQECSPKGDEHVVTCFIIQDTGIGMSPEFLHTMFDSFSREESRVRKIEGTGLGLTIVKSLLDMMGGTISVQSTVGQGSCFSISLDLPKADYEEYVAAPVSSLPSDKTLHILLAEDNEFNYDIAQALLHSHGFITEHAPDGQTAVDMYCNAPEKWDLILMDLRMPVLNGYQATQEIRRFEESLTPKRHIPIFALSADVFAEDIENCFAAGMEGHLAKPININDLLHTLQRYIK